MNCLEKPKTSQFLMKNNFSYRKFQKEDKTEILSMMKTFYSSNCVQTNGSEEIFEKDFETCLKTDFLDGYVFIIDEKIIGYSMIAKSFSTEFAKICLFLEDFYIKPKYRGQGIISKFIELIKNENQNSILRIQVEKENEHAYYVYKKAGFKVSPYLELIYMKDK